MDDPRKWGEDHINKSLKQIDSETWLVGGLIIHRSPHPSNVATWNDDSDNSSYTLTEAPTPPPSATTPPDSPHIKLVYEAGDALATWSIGNNVLCKVRYVMKGITPESVTLKFVQDKQPSFESSKVIHHAFAGDRSFIFLQRLPGRTLNDAWPSLDEHWRRQYVKAIVNAIKEMAEWKGHVIGGVDGQDMIESYLETFQRKDKNVPGPEEYASAKLQARFELLGMDCLDLVFNHLTFGPETIIVEDEPKSGKIGFSDFEITGFFPRSWIMTKCGVSGEMSLDPEVTKDPQWLRRELSEELEANGFEDFAADWYEWFQRVHPGFGHPEP